MDTDKIIEYDPKRIREAVVLKRLAFFGVFLATVPTFLLIVLVPMLYNYVQMIQSELRDELDFCRHNADHLWDEYARIQRIVGPAAKLNKRAFYNKVFRSKREAASYDALVVIEGTSTSAPASDKPSGSAAAPAPHPSEGYDKPASGPTEVPPSSGTDNAGYENGQTPAVGSSQPSGPKVEASAGSGPNAEATFDGKTRENAPEGGEAVNHEASLDGTGTRAPPVEPPTTHVPEMVAHETCSCGMGPSGSPGEPGPDGIDGKDGAPGEAGKDGNDAKADEMPNAENMCFMCEPSAPGPAGAPGPPGPSGNAGPPGSDGQGGSPGIMGVPGPAGPPGSPGEAGMIGAPGESGVLSDAPGMEGPPGIPGPAGEPGAPGEAGTPGKPGKDGPVGPPGELGQPGVKGNDAENGVQGEAGELGPNGACDHCPPPRTAPGY